jgi:hypothetical protein
MTPASIDHLLTRIAAHMNLDRDVEREVLDEIRSHLEEAVEAARKRGVDEKTALAEAAARFGVEDVGVELQQAHLGWGTAEAIVAAGLPVACALVLRWIVFAPEGTQLHWQELLTHPALWVVAAAALIIPLMLFDRWRYALATWAFFWFITVASLLVPTLRW